MRFSIRLATEGDVAAITEIYNQAISLRSATGDLDPVSIGSRSAWLATHDPHRYPVYCALADDDVAGYCSISPYRPGRRALRYTAEISYYIHEAFRGQGAGSRLIEHALQQCPQLGIRTLFAILMDINTESVRLLEKYQFERWGHMPGVADYDGSECGQYYYGRRVAP